jgi:FAD:protein FMN transferase
MQAPPSAAPQNPVQKELLVARRAMGCEFSVRLPGTARKAVDAACAALDEVERLEGRLSVFLPESQISAVNREGAFRWVQVDAEVFHLLEASRRMCLKTAGAFDAYSGAIVHAWGFRGGEKRVPEAAELRTALDASGSRHLLLDAERQAVRFSRQGVLLNLGSIGKGFAIDQALRRMRAEFPHVRCVLMQGGQSSVRAVAAPAGESRGWPVTIGDPDHPLRPVARVYLRHGALGTSGGSNQFFVWQGRRYGHVLDPRTGWPADHLASASAVACTAREADALSTAFFVMGAAAVREFCRRHPGIGAVLVHSKHAHSSGRQPNDPRPQFKHPPRVEIVGEVDAEVIS